MISLNKRQKQVVNIVDGPILVLAGPGSGKTRTISERYISMVKVHQINPEEILALTFSRKAAAELKSRIVDRIPEKDESVEVYTFNAFGYKYIRKYIKSFKKRNLRK